MSYLFIICSLFFPLIFLINSDTEDGTIFSQSPSEIIIERNEDKSEHRFDLEEPILTNISESLLKRTENFLNIQKIKFDKIESKLIEND